MKIAIAFCLSPFIFSTVLAQDSLSVPVSVDFVCTGGAWTTPSAHGHYRIIVYNFGWEHVHSSLKIDWLAEVDSTQSIIISSSGYIKEINDEGLSLDKPEFIIDPNETMIRVTGSSPYTIEKKSWLILLDAKTPGKYEVALGKNIKKDVNH